MKKKINKKVVGIVTGGVAAVGMITAGVVLATKNTESVEEIVYKETEVRFGDLTVGVTEDSEVNIGTQTQTFDLDISALVSDSSSSSTSSAGAGFGGAGGMQMAGMPGGSMGGMQSGSLEMTFSFGSVGFSSQEQELEIEEVHVTVGQKVNVGDVLYTLTEESVSEIRTQLQEDITDTLAEYDTLKIEQQESRVDARQGYDTYVLNGKLAQVVYNETVAELQQKIDDAAETVNDKQVQINENLLELQELAAELTTAKKYLQEAEFAVEQGFSERYDNAFYYATYENAREDAEAFVEELEDEITSLEEENEKLLEEVAQATTKWNQAKRDYESGVLSAKQTMETSLYYASVASEWYDIQTAGLDTQLASVYEGYEDASAKLSEFDGYIVDHQVVSEYSGVVTEVSLSVGDGVSRNTGLITLYDEEQVTMAVSVLEDDLETIDTKGKVNISLTAYPDVIFAGVISEISDAEYDSSSGEVYYTITVTVQGDVSGLYEGMTGEVTFVTEESQQVIYVSKRAVFTEGEKSYVKLYDEEGNVVTKEVVTGFTDGVNIEIVEGLSEGDFVLIESKVTKS